MSYEGIKSFVSGHKAQLTTVIACSVMFVVGFGTGKAFGKPQPDTSQYSDYSANSGTKPGAETEDALTAASKPSTKASPAADALPTNATNKKVDTSLPESSQPVPGQPCVIKGNISSSSKIYHVKGGASYEKTSPEACFNTEAEAVAAGFRKAKR